MEEHPDAAPGCDLAISRVLVVGNRTLRRETSLLEARILKTCGRRPSIAFLQDEASPNGIWDLLGSGSFPQVFYDSGLNALADDRIRRYLSRTDTFKSYRPEEFGQKADGRIGALLEGAPEGITVSGAVPLVLWVDERLRNGRSLPERWEDILDPQWAGDITVDNMRFSRNNMVCIAISRLFGEGGLEALIGGMRMSASNVTSDVRIADNRTAVHVTAWPFLKACEALPYVHVICPEEGAIASPVLSLAKAGLDEAGVASLSYFYSDRWAAIQLRNGLVSCTALPLAESFPWQSGQFPSTLYWPGWDAMEPQALEWVNSIVQDCLDRQPIRGVNCR